MRRGGQVRGREAELLAAASGAAHHDALQPVIAAQSRGRGDDVAGVDAGADVGRRERHRSVRRVVGPPHRPGDQRIGFDLEAEPLAELGQQLDVARRLVAEGEVLADHDLRRVQPLHQHLVHELLGRQARDLSGERQHAEHLDAELFGQLGAAPQGGQLRRMTTRAHHLGRVRVEGHQHTGDVAAARLLHRVRDQLLMPPMHAVEDADGHHAPAPAAGDLLQTTPSLHDQEAYCAATR